MPCIQLWKLQTQHFDIASGLLTELKLRQNNIENSRIQQFKQHSQFLAVISVVTTFKICSAILRNRHSGLYIHSSRIHEGQYNTPLSIRHIYCRNNKYALRVGICSIHYIQNKGSYCLSTRKFIFKTNGYALHCNRLETCCKSNHILRLFTSDACTHGKQTETGFTSLFHARAITNMILKSWTTEMCVCVCVCLLCVVAFPKNCFR